MEKVYFVLSLIPSGREISGILSTSRNYCNTRSVVTAAPFCAVGELVCREDLRYACVDVGSDLGDGTLRTRFRGPQGQDPEDLPGGLGASWLRLLYHACSVECLCCS